MGGALKCFALISFKPLFALLSIFLGARVHEGVIIRAYSFQSLAVFSERPPSLESQLLNRKLILLLVPVFPRRARYIGRMNAAQLAFYIAIGLAGVGLIRCNPRSRAHYGALADTRHSHRFVTDFLFAHLPPPPGGELILRGGRRIFGTAPPSRFGLERCGVAPEPHLPFLIDWLVRCFSRRIAARWQTSS